MKNLVFSLVLCYVLGCDSLSNEVPIADQSQLEKMLQEIVSLSESQSCTDASDWLFIAYGAKACGGPIGYIAYSKRINQDNYIKLVNKFTEAQAAFNRKTNAVSDCMLMAEPSGVFCEDGKPKLAYS